MPCSLDCPQSWLPELTCYVEMAQNGVVALWRPQAPQQDKGPGSPIKLRGEFYSDSPLIHAFRSDPLHAIGTRASPITQSHGFVHFPGVCQLSCGFKTSVLGGRPLAFLQAGVGTLLITRQKKNKRESKVLWRTSCSSGLWVLDRAP